MTIDEFRNVELRVGKVTEAGRVDGSEKLLKLRIDLGDAGEKQILSGIAKEYAPEALVGREVVIIANLDPRTMMGMESQGMLLAAHGEDGMPVILTVDREVAPGASIS